MFNLKKLIKSQPLTVPVSKAEKDLLQYFIATKPAFENWFSSNKNAFPRLRFHFYYPNAIDFFFDEFKLFTAYYKKEEKGMVVLKELKMSDVNKANIKTTDWKPFRDLMLTFLTDLEQTNHNLMLQEQRSLHEYKAICTGKEALPEGGSYIREVLLPQLV
jgi:hypothetical protein